MTKNHTQMKIEEVTNDQEQYRINAGMDSNNQEILWRAADLEILLQIDRDLNSRLDFDQVLQTTRKWVTRLAKTDRVWILVVQEEEDNSGFYVFPHDHTDPGYELIKRAMVQAKMQVSAIGNQNRAQLVAPILYGNKPLGAFLIQREEPFYDNEVNNLELLFNRCAAAIANARLNLAVQRASHAKTKFVSLVTHELRNPMTCIKGYADLLIQGAIGPINEQQRNFINVIRRNVEWMSTLISDLADFSRIESGRLDLDTSRIPVRDFIEETLRNLRSKLHEKHQNLEVDIEPGLPDVYADYDRLSQILNNILCNAWKFTPIDGRIRVTAKSKEGFACIEVEDNGMGISTEDQTKLFSKFFRSEEPMVREEPGWGLGLYVAKYLAEAMGGDIGFKSTPGKGSCFWFTIPVYQVYAASEEV